MPSRSQARNSPMPPESAAAQVRRTLEQSRGPLTSTQIAEQTGLTRQVVRHHLRTMLRAGDVHVVPAHNDRNTKRRRGRPAQTWSLRHDADPRALAQVAHALATLIDDIPPADVEDQLMRIGKSIARQPGPGDDPMFTGLARMGFSPRIISESDGHTRIRLDTCPFVDPTEGVTDTRICQVHKLLATGMTRAGQQVEHLEIDPRGAGCCIHIADHPAQK